MKFHVHACYDPPICGHSTLTRRGPFIFRRTVNGLFRHWETFRLQSPARARRFLRLARRGGWFRAVARYKWVVVKENKNQ